MCTPIKGKYNSIPCGFSDLPKKVIDAEEIPSLSVSEKPFTDIDFNHLDEFLDYFKFPTLTLVKGTVLCHSTSPRNFYNKYKGINVDIYNWWSEYFPGQASYKGGWFTYETPYGGPEFGINLYYRLEEDLTLLFIPNDFDKKYSRSDPRYFSEYHRANNKFLILSEIIEGIYFKEEVSHYIIKFLDIIPDSEIDIKVQNLLSKILLKPYLTQNLLDELIEFKNYYKIKSKNKKDDVLNEYNDIYSGSHIIEGVENWEEKGYTPIEHPEDSYADYLAIKLANLGFNGYISCDECEVYITHEAMKRVLTKPFKYDFSQNTSLADFDILKTLMEKSFETPSRSLNITKDSDRKKIKQTFIPLQEFLEYSP